MDQSLYHRAFETLQGVFERLTCETIEEHVEEAANWLEEKRGFANSAAEMNEIVDNIEEVTKALCRYFKVKYID